MLSSTNLTQIVPRPNVGTQGRHTKIRANFYKVNTVPTNNKYHYDVAFSPDIPPKLCPAVWNALVKSAGSELVPNDKSIIFDGRKNAFAARALDLGKDSKKEFTLDLTSHPSFGPSPKNVFKVEIKLVNVINMSELQLFLDKKSECTPNFLKVAIMLLDNLLRFLPSLTHPTFGRSIFTTDNRRSLPNGVEVLQGFFQSVRPAEGQLFVNVDVSATAVYESGPLPEAIAKILNKRSIDEFRNGINGRDLQTLNRVAKGKSIQVTHRGERKRTSKITGFGPAANLLEFTNEEGVKQTVASYFVACYNKRLRYPFLPCVQIKKDIYLPMEVCELLPYQRYKKKLSGQQTSEFIKITCQPPNVRVNKINDGLKLLQHKNNPYLEEFGMSVNQEMEVIKARVLKAPSIKYNTSQPDFVPTGGSWSLRGKRLSKPATLKSWGVVNFCGSISTQAVQAWLREHIQTMSDFGLSVVNRTPPIFSSDPQADIDRVMKDAYLKAGNAAKAEPQILMCILPNVNSPVYGEIKRITDTVIGIPSQCIKSNNILKPNKQYCANVTLKMNVKLGGSNYALGPKEFITPNKTTVFFGADVKHPSPGAEHSPSIAAVVASTDSQATKYISTIRYQNGRTEIIQDMANMVKEMLIKFYKQNQRKPDNIVFYRDGVSEGQFTQVLELEVAAIKAACTSLEQNYKPKLTFVVVQKRHHARFFPIRKEDSDKNGNCLPGTVVDTNITHPFEFDFYLQSHNAIKGTARSSRYIVVYDDNKYSADVLQEISHKLCYVYARSSCAVSIVSPAYYADIVAARGRLHCRGGDWSENTTNTADSATQKASFASVNAKLHNTMYYM